MTDNGEHSTWDQSDLPRRIVRHLNHSRTLNQLAEALNATDARVLWYLAKLREAGRVREDAGIWSRTDAGSRYAEEPIVAAEEGSQLPGRSVFDYQQAYADAAAGMFGSVYVQAGGEHAGRVPYARAQEFSERLTDLVSEYFSPEAVDPGASPKYGFRWVLTPVDLHPLADRPA